MGNLKKRNWFRPGNSIAHMTPMVQARSVLTGMNGSSVFDTADRTSGYGESSVSVVKVFYEDHNKRPLTQTVLTEAKLLCIPVRIERENIVYGKSKFNARPCNTTLLFRVNVDVNMVLPLRRHRAERGEDEAESGWGWKKHDNIETESLEAMRVDRMQ